MDDSSTMAQAQVQARTSASPLVVDMDGALIRTDMLFEAFAAGLFQRPLATLLALGSLLKGRAAFKSRIAALGVVDVESLPEREALVSYLEQQSDAGREIHLVSAGAREHVEAVAERFGVFASAQGSTPGDNLKGARKAEALAERFPGGYAYVGDSRADAAVWKMADTIGLAGARPDVARAARRLGKPVEFEDRSSGAVLAPWRRALRPQQWAKNLLVFVPLILGHQFTNLRTDLAVLAGFACLCVVASATYLVNDLADLAADRRHPTKRSRPLASGALSISHALIAILPMMLTALGAAFWLSPAFGAGLLAYTLLTLAYSMRLKRIVMLDVTVLGCLYAVRLVMGQALVGGEQSVWLLTFSMFFFASLALTKRHSEIESRAASGSGATQIKGRGYRTTDAPLTLATGVSFSASAILIVVIYLTSEAFPSGLYAHPQRLWATPILIQLWLSRVWLLAHRGEMHEDPVAFALHDKASLMLGAALAIDVVSAVM